MKKHHDRQDEQESEDTLREEYDFAAMKPIGRGQYAKAMQSGYKTVVHHEDGSKTVTFHNVSSEQLEKLLIAAEQAQIE